jgi:hypothetical protein
MGLDVSVCDRQGNEVFEDRLGDVGFISRIHKVISRYPDQFPIVVAKVTYSGAHFGDEIPADEVPRLADEAELLLSFEFDACDRDKESISEFAEKLRLTCRAAIQYDTGIRF